MKLMIWSVQSLSHVQLFATPWTAAHQACLSINQLPEIAQTHVHCIGDAIQPSYPLSSPYPLAFNLSHHQGLFQWVSSLPQVAKVLEFQLQHQHWKHSPSSEYSWLVFFRIDWLDLLAVQETLKSSPTPQFKSIYFLALSFLYSPTLIHTWLLEKP